MKPAQRFGSALAPVPRYRTWLLAVAAFFTLGGTTSATSASPGRPSLAKQTVSPKNQRLLSLQVEGSSARAPRALVSANIDPKWLEGSTVKVFLDRLKRSGADALEFSLQPQGANWGAVRDLIEISEHAGFKTAFHLPYKDDFNLNGFASTRREELIGLYRPALDYAAETANKSGPITLVLHGPHGSNDRQSLERDTLEFLRWSTKQYPNLRFAVELFAKKPHCRKVGDSKPELVKVVRRAHVPAVGICWDMGHDAQSGHKPTPSDFASNVSHVHVHDIGPGGADHYPLLYGRVHWKKDLRNLLRQGFHGIVTVELKGAEVDEAAKTLGKEPVQLLEDSIRQVRRQIDSVPTVGN